MLTDAEAIHAAYCERLSLLFNVFANQPDEEANKRFQAGVMQARTARDRALLIVGEVSK